MQSFHFDHSAGAMQKSIIKSSPFTTFWVLLLSRQIIPNSHFDWSHGHSHCDGFSMEPSIFVHTIWLSSRKNASKQCASSWICGKMSPQKMSPQSAQLSPFCTTVVNIFNPVLFSKWRIHGTLLISVVMLACCSSHSARASPIFQYWCYMMNACCSNCCWSAKSSGIGMPLKIKSYASFLAYCCFCSSDTLSCHNS